MGSIVLLPPGPDPAPLPPPSPYPGPAPGRTVTISGLERALGQRVGPYAELMAQQGLAPAQIQVDALRSTVEAAGWENLYVLRRGVYAPQIAVLTVPGVPPGAQPGDPIPGFDLRDRSRMIKSFAAESGSLEVDRDYVQSPLPGEALELHLLHPEWELRPAVLQGLDRVFLFDRIPLVRTFTPPLDEPLPLGDLTGNYPWLTDRSAVWGLELGGVLVRGWDALQDAGAVLLHLPAGGVNAGGVPTASASVLVRRPGWSIVNGLEWEPGHIWQDPDVLSVPLPYAVAGAHVAAWDVARIRLMPGAAAGMALSENDCGRELTRMTNRYFRPDVRQPEDRYPGAARMAAPGGASSPHWRPRVRSGGGWIVNA